MIFTLTHRLARSQFPPQIIVLFLNSLRIELNGRFHGTYPPNINEGTHLISGKGPTQFQVVPFVF